MFESYLYFFFQYKSSLCLATLCHILNVSFWNFLINSMANFPVLHLDHSLLKDWTSRRLWQSISMLAIYFKGPYVMLPLITLSPHKLLITSSTLLCGARVTGERMGVTLELGNMGVDVVQEHFRPGEKENYQISRLIWRSLWSLRKNYLIESNLSES